MNSVTLTEIRIKLMSGHPRLHAFCSITLNDAFVIRDLKIIEGAKGLFIAMPDRKKTDHCPYCTAKNELTARFCNQCGERLSDDRAKVNRDGRLRLYADVAHPINNACRDFLQTMVMRAYAHEREQSKRPGYVCTYDEYQGREFAEYAFDQFEKR